MKMIYKYRVGNDVTFGEPVEVDIPGYVKIVHFDRDAFGNICVWAQVDSNPRFVYTVPVFVLPTGREFDAAKHKAAYFSTMNDDGFFWHLYVGTPVAAEVIQ
jgi:hypothetical protein